VTQFWPGKMKGFIHWNIQRGLKTTIIFLDCDSDLPFISPFIQVIFRDSWPYQFLFGEIGKLPICRYPAVSITPTGLATKR
jgi:hypothetical protein